METITLQRIPCANCNGTGFVSIPACHLNGFDFWCERGYCDCNLVPTSCGCDKGTITVRTGTNEVWKRV